ncbi:helix-turn-helix domain-containing protein [Pikeienuella sp. HZG-20]|uniref:helix-turn-helix domain-containing protein n=1 Tax=Paludibacillus litoralis TaxID=3133267 RepID=UPI0030EBC6D3
MGSEYHPGLRGFDSFELKLGDELRGERASKGKSLLDVQRELLIRADYIAAIEDADASAFPFAGYAAGYVRSYARYLDLDGDDVYRRFCEESGFTGVEITGALSPKERAATQARPQTRAVGASAADRAVISNRFMKSNANAARVDLGASLRGLASVAVLVALVGGLSYGGWSLLQDLQRLGFAPLPTAPEVLVTAPDIFAPAEMKVAGPAEPGRADDDRITLASIYAAQEAAAPPVSPRDGPISSIDPRSAGIYAVPAAVVVADAQIEPPVEHVLAAVDETPAAEIAASALSAPPQGVDVYATEDAWVRVRDGERRVLFTGILGPGERFTLPEGASAPQLRAGNAGAVYILVDGTAFGPLGDGPEVAKNVDLKPDAVRALYPAAVNFSAPPRADREANLTGDENTVALRGE